MANEGWGAQALLRLRGRLAVLEADPDLARLLRWVRRLPLRVDPALEDQGAVATTDGVWIRVNPRRFPAYSEEEGLYILLHEAFHAALGHPARYTALHGAMRRRVEALARAARAGRVPEGWDSGEFRAWRSAWAQAFRDHPDPWQAWEETMGKALGDLLQAAGDLQVNAWVDLVVEVVRRMELPVTIRPPGDALREEDPAERLRILGSSLEAMVEQGLERLLRSLPGSEGEEARREGRGMGEVLARAARAFPEAFRDLRPAPEGSVREGEGISPEAREILRGILRVMAGHGLLPGEAVERILPAPSPRIPWRRALREMLRQILPAPEEDLDWTRKNPRVQIPGAYVPRRGVGEIRGIRALLIARDTSGSMAPEVLARVAGAILEAARAGVARILVLDVDAEIQDLWAVDLDPEVPDPLPPEIRRERDLAAALARVRGRGGTVFRSLFRALRGRGEGPWAAILADLAARGGIAGMVFFTDGEARMPAGEDRPPFPVLWIAPRAIPVPFGRVLPAPELFDKEVME